MRFKINFFNGFGNIFNDTAGFYAFANFYHYFMITSLKVCSEP